jgi:uncharacterized protein YydD (DUF2326 family)
MIRSVTSTLPTFKTINFGQGLNILLADVADTSTERHTRNSAGKTSLVEIVHFVLGSDAGKSSIFKHEDLIDHSFSLEVLIDQRWIRATRSGAADDIIFVSADDARALGFEVPLSLFDLDKAEDVPLGIDVWKALLGQAWFQLPIDRSDGEFMGRGAPTFRQLIGYFARRRKIGGLDTIERTSRDQQPGNWQVALSYLLGLNWHVARRFQDMRDRRKSLQALSKAVKSGELGEIFGTTAEIRPELARVEDRVKLLRAQVDEFQVHDSYRELANQAASLKDEISGATFLLAEADSAIAYLTKSLEQEGPADYANVEALYAAAGVELPNVALRRFEDVKAFQASVAANRRHYLEEQIASLEAKRKTSSADLAAASAARTEILCALDGKGAFEDLMWLNEALAEQVARAELLRSKLQHAAVLENNRTQLKAEIADLELQLQQSLAASEDAIKRATVLVDQAITELYDDRTGNLIIEASRTGPQFRIDIQGGGNRGGIDMMKVFCLDTALMRIAFERFSPGPLMLIHDSHIFDGVDSRQVSRALAYGQRIAEKTGGQYIVALNSDEFEKADAISETSFWPQVNSVKLTDDETGGLFGFRFDLG